MRLPSKTTHYSSPSRLKKERWTNVSMRTIYDAIAAKKIPAVYVTPTSPRIPIEGIEAYEFFCRV